MKSVHLLASFALLVTFTAARAQDAITIKLKDTGEGESVLTKKSEQTTSKVKVADANGKVVFEKNEERGEVAEFTENIIKRPVGKQPTLLERSYTKLQIKTDDKVSASPLQGKTVVIELKGDKYVFTFKGGEEVPASALSPLKKDFSRKEKSNADIDRIMLPKTAVKVGDTWKLDMGEIHDALFKGSEDVDIDAAKATGVGKLLKAYKKDGRQFGEVSYKLVMPLKSVGAGAMRLKFNDGAAMTLDFMFDSCIDGTSQAANIRMNLKMTGVAALPDAPGALATLDVTTTIQGSAEPVKK